MNQVKYPLLTLAFLICALSGINAQPGTSQSELERYARESMRAMETYPDSVSIFASSGLALAKQAGDMKMIADFNKYMGIGSWFRGESEAAIGYLNEAIDKNKLLKREDELAICMSDLGLVYARYGNFARAVELQLEAIRITERSFNDELTATIHNNMGIVYKDNKKLLEALMEYKLAAELYKKAGAEEKLAGCLLNTGNIEAVRREFTRATKYYQEAIQIFERKQLYRGLASGYNGMADVHYEQGKFGESEIYRQRALSVSRMHGILSSEIIALTGSGELALIREDIADAIVFFRSGIEKSRLTNATGELLRLYKGMSAALEKNDELPSSLYYYKRYAAIRDSLFNRETQSYLSNLRVVSELNKKELEINGLKKDRQIAFLSRNIMLGAGSGLMVVLALVIYSLQLKRRKDQVMLEKIEIEHRSREEKSQVELRAQKVREEELTRELDFRSRALTTYTLNLVQKNGMMEEVKAGLQTLVKGGSPHDAELKKLVRLIDYSYSLDKDWDGFRTYFEQVHPEFFMKIKENYPQISTTELRLCALIRLSLSIKEAATILNIAPDSVKVARHRIRKKLNLPSDASITDFIMSI